MNHSTSDVDAYSNFIYLRTYSRWNDELGRRETWNETVDRYMNFMEETVGSSISEDDYNMLSNSIKNMEVLPSMRLLWSAGEAARKNASSAYNCSFAPVDNLSAFPEALFLLTSGAGVGFSCEKRFVEQLPEVKPFVGGMVIVHSVKDSREGWADALRFGIDMWYAGRDVYFDYNQVRPLGSILKTFGGRACLTGDTIVYKDRKKSRGYNEVTIRDLYEMKNRIGKWEHLPDHFSDIKLRSLDENSGELFRNQLLDVISNGVRPVYLVVTENGYRIKATDNHRFLTQAGDYSHLSNFSVGDLIAVNGSSERKTGVCSDCGVSISRRAIRCKSCFDSYQTQDCCLETTARQRKRCSDYRKSNLSCERCGEDNKRLVVHHINENPLDNDETNLECLCELCHQSHHARMRTYGDPYSHKYLSFDRIISIEYAGAEEVFDLCMEGPNHNFVANGFISHNSGPEPLKKLLDFTRATILSASGRKLRPIEVHDIMCMIAQVVVAGGTRRSSLISLSDLDEEEMRRAKSGSFPVHRYMANNSAVYNEFDAEGFDLEWSNLVSSGTGERGIFNRKASSQVPRRRREVITDMIGCNPCQPKWATILTPSGIKTLGDISKGDVIWSSEGWTTVVDKWSTGTNEVYRYRTSSGVFYGTERHRVLSNGHKVEARYADTIDTLSGNLEPSDILPTLVMDGLVVGDGSVHKASNNLVYLLIGTNDKDYFSSEVGGLILKHRPGLKDTAYEISTNILADELPKTFLRRVPKRYVFGTPSEVASFLRGLFSANGSVANNRIQLKTSSKGLAEDVQIMLSSLGISSYITGIGSGTTFVEFSNGGYECRESYSVNITSDRDIFSSRIGFIQKYKNEKVREPLSIGRSRKSTYDIVEVEFVSVEETFDITVDNSSHTYWTGGCNVSNCGEILLNPRTMCNLTNVVGREGDTLKSLMHKIKAATILGTYQSTLTNFTYLSPEWQKNCEEERLLGVSLTGVYDSLLLRDPRVLEILRDYAVYTNKLYSEKMGIKQSVSVTCVKPSGNTSQLVNASSGAHPRYSEHYVRRVRIAASDPLFEMMKDQGVPYFPEVGQEDNPATYVLEFPIKSPKNAITRHDVSALDQLNMWLTLKKNFTEHTVSATIYVAEDEWDAVKKWVVSNWSGVSGLSFLPKEDGNIKYNLAPYEEIGAEEYSRRVNELKINFEHLRKYESSDNTEGAKEYACSSGACEL